MKFHKYEFYIAVWLMFSFRVNYNVFMIVFNYNVFMIVFVFPPTVT